ncbi:hypothetical protein C8T65DRAFT_164550 [Cerioporus squamosus]|nr:hypothetical protein C8T65DRAFT_164550 [Cerioporus squamosus]
MASEYGPLVLYLESTLPLQLCTISASALVVYDSFLTLGTEFAVFWCHRLKLSSILYFVNRYVEIMSCISATLLLFPVQNEVPVRFSRSSKESAPYYHTSPGQYSLLSERMLSRITTYASQPSYSFSMPRS